MASFDIPQADYYEALPDGFDIYSWSPTAATEVARGFPQAKSTQVHMHIPMANKAMRIMVRFKGIGTLDRLIAALIKHRQDVWGPPADLTVWMNDT
jgi:hypothetical protein